MFHYNGTSWVRLASSPAPRKNSGTTTNFHGITSGNSNYTSEAAHCSTESPVSATKSFKNDVEQQQSKNIKRAPLKQLFPRTPTPFKKAYAAAVRKGGRVEQLDLQKSPELFEDLQEIIFQDVVLPPAKRGRKTMRHVSVDQATTSASTSTSNNFNIRYHSMSEDHQLAPLDTTSTPSKVLNDSSFAMSPPFPSTMSTEATSSQTANSISEYGEFVEPMVPPRPFTEEWYQIACGRTRAQVELTDMAKNLLRNASSARRLST